MKKLGIIGAMDVEVETLKAAMTEKKETVLSGMDFCEGKMHGLPVVVARCGVGKVNAALCVQALKDCFAVTHIVNTGIAGSLNAALDIGDLVISQNAMYHDFDCTGFGYPMGMVPNMPAAYPADAALLQYALEAAQAVCPGHVQTGTVASGDQFVCTQAQKDRIIAVTGGLCTEMEGAAIAQASYVNGLPFVIIRAISDKADNSAEMDYPTFEAAAARHCAAVTMALVEKMQN